jgi:uncharacterized protein (TIGR03067 family)
MKAYLTALILTVMLAPISFAGAAENAVAGDLARLQGRWVTRAGARRNIVVTLNVEGCKALVDITTPQGLKFRASGELRLDEKAAPRALDWVGFSGLDSQDLPEIPAIYEIKGDTFKVCNGGPNCPRPSEFKAGESILADIHVFERVKPAADPGANARPSGASNPSQRTGALSRDGRRLAD